jgi:hypothetical protein
MPEDLRTVANAWATLPGPVRTGIVATVKAADGGDDDC